MQAMKHIGRVFKESDSDASAMVVLEGYEPLGDEAHRYYAELIRRFRADPTHITHVQDFWGDPLSAAGAQSADGKATYVQLYLTGNMGEALANDGIGAVRQTSNSVPVPAGVHVYITGTTALFADQHKVGDKSLKLVTAITVAVILVSLFIVYRWVVTVALVLVMVMLEVVAARGVVAALGHYGLIGLSTFSVNLLTMLGIAAGTDYAIFGVGPLSRGAHCRTGSRDCLLYDVPGHRARRAGFGPDGCGVHPLPAFHPVAHVPIPGYSVGDRYRGGGAGVVDHGSGDAGDRRPVRAVRGQTRCTHTRLATGGHRRGALARPDPGRDVRAGAGGLFALPGYKTSYNDRNFMPKSIPAMQGFDVADRHFNQARMNPELLMVQTDQDLRTSCGHADHRAHRQKHLPHPGNRTGADHLAPAGYPD